MAPPIDYSYRRRLPDSPLLVALVGTCPAHYHTPASISAVNRWTAHNRGGSEGPARRWVEWRRSKISKNTLFRCSGSEVKNFKNTSIKTPTDLPSPPAATSHLLVISLDYPLASTRLVGCRCGWTVPRAIAHFPLITPGLRNSNTPTLFAPPSPAQALDKSPASSYNPPNNRKT